MEQFIQECRAALTDPSPAQAVQDAVARRISDPSALIRTLGEPTRAGIQTLHHTPELTVINVVWAPRMMILPHNHRMWAVIGVYTGREDNIFWRRKADSPQVIEAAGARSLGDRDTVPLGKDIIHSVTNPVSRFTGAIHVYGGDFFGTERSEWDPETLSEQPYDIEKNVRLFEEANASSPDPGPGR